MANVIVKKKIRKIKILVTDLMAKLLHVLEMGNECEVIFILGPPGTGKTTSLYWLYKQCQGLPQFHPIAIPLHQLGDMHGDVLTLISNKQENQQLVFLIDLSSSRSLSVDNCQLFRNTVAVNSGVKLVLAASSSYAIYQSTATGGASFRTYYSLSYKLQSHPFNVDLARKFIQQLGKPTEEMEEIVETTKCVPRLLELSAAFVKSSDPNDSSLPSSPPQQTLKEAVQDAISSEYERILLYMCEHKELVTWEDESKLLMASSHQLPITVFGMDKDSAPRLILIRSFLLHLRKDLVPVPYVDFDQQVFTQIIRHMSSYSVSIRTNNEAVIADYFEKCLPRSILPNFHVTIGSLDDRKTTLNIVLSFDTMPCPDLDDATMLTIDTLWKTSVTYKAVDYVGLKKGLNLRSENPEDKYVVLIQATIQKKKKQNDKMNSILRVPNDLTAGKAGVLFIMVNPYWQDFDEGFRVAVDKHLEQHQGQIGSNSGGMGNQQTLVPSKLCWPNCIVYIKFECIVHFSTT